MALKYILAEDGRTPLVCEDTLEWGRWMEDHRKRVVSQDHVGQFWISTVFLGLNHNYGRGLPVLWETMVFDKTSERPWEDLDCRRYEDFDSACLGHNEMVAKYRAKQDD